MKRSIFVFEHICGGGMIDEDLPADLIQQGAAMLCAVIEDFQIAGHPVSTMLDHRVPFALNSAQITTVEERGRLMPYFDQLAEQADAVLVIAPEFDRLLECWLMRLQELNVCNLGCSVESAACCGDKMRMAKVMEQFAVPSPPVSRLDFSGDIRLPVVVKPRFGAGCEDTFVCCDAHTLRELSDRYGDRVDQWIIQPWHEGLPVSASFIVHDRKCIALRAGEQLFTGSSQIHYEGGCLPLKSQMEERAIDLGRRAIEAVPGLSGFVGVDMILGSEQEADVVIEINPRLTVSYCGLRALCETNLAAGFLEHPAPLAWLDQLIRFDCRGRISMEVAS